VKSKIAIVPYRRLHLPVNTHAQNLFSCDVKRLFRPKCEVLLLDAAKREDVFNQESHLGAGYIVTRKT